MTEDKKSTTVEQPAEAAKPATESKPVANTASQESTDNKRSRAPRTNNFGNRDSRNHGGHNDHNGRNDHGDHKGGRRNDRRGNRRGRGPKDDFEEKVVTINRVTKVTKGGRHFRFAAVVVVGNHKGQVGFGVGKANEVPDAIKKGVKEARKNLFRVPLRGTTVPHEILGEYGAGQVLIKPAKQGTGVIAGGPARAVIELAGIADIYAKSLGSNTPINMIRATVDGLARMETLNSVNRLRFNKQPKTNTTTNKDIKKDESVKPAGKSAEVK